MPENPALPRPCHTASAPEPPPAPSVPDAPLLPGETEAGISFGSNLGDRAAWLEQAIARLAALPGVRLLARAPLYETDPVDVPEAFRDRLYLNTVAIYAVRLPLAEWSRLCHAAEDALGRVRTGYHHPRTIDIDLLYFGDAVSDIPHLHLPHPQISSRVFVCRPLADVRPALRLPGFSRTVAELLAALPDEGVRVYRP